MPGIKESGSGPQSNGVVKEKRTRRRVIRCCENCRSSKNKCSRHPIACKRCLENQLKCVYLPQDDEGWEVIEKGKEDHRKIENRIAKRARRETKFDEGSEDESDMEPSPLIATDAAYEDDDEIEDNGVRVGRFNLTKRIGSFYRPKMIEELTQMLHQQDLSRSELDRQEFNSLPKPDWLDAAAGPKVLDPHPDYIAPSLFSLTIQSDQHVHKLLLSQDLADKIMENYWRSVHPVACLVHRPSFQERYNVFWYNSLRRSKDTPESTQALVYAALFAGVVSMDAESVTQELGGERAEWVQTLEKSTAISLSRAHVIRTEKPETMQAFVMYLIPMCRSVISRTLATLVSAAIDLARGMGLNKDGSDYGYDAVVTQVHRMIWHQLCFLDIRVCEAQCPRARIRKDEYNTEFPLNVMESELKSSRPPPRESSKGWTGMTLCNARMECNEKIREIFAARQRARQEDESESAYIKRMLEMIYEFQHYIETKYFPMIDDGIPIQHYTRLIIKLHCRRMHAMILHEYHMSTARGRLPEQLARIVIKSGLETMEISKEIETSDALRPWRWYAGAIQQHSYATLMLIEVFASPGTDYAKRAWESLDWIFQVPPYVPHIHKGRWVLEGTVGVMKQYLKARKLRCPIHMDERLVTLPSTLPTLTSSQTLVITKREASSPDMDMTYDLQTMLIARKKCKTNEQVYTGQEPASCGLLPAASHSAKSERVSSEENLGMLKPIETPPDESMDSISSWQSIVDSVSAIHHPGYPPADIVSCPSGYVVGQNPKDVGDFSISGIAQDQIKHYALNMWNMNTAPPLQGSCFHYPSSNDTWDDHISHHSAGKLYATISPRMLEQGPHGLPFRDYPHRACATTAVANNNPSAFTPIDQEPASPAATSSAPSPNLLRHSYEATTTECRFVFPRESTPQLELGT